MRTVLRLAVLSLLCLGCQPAVECVPADWQGIYYPDCPGEQVAACLTPEGDPVAPANCNDATGVAFCNDRELTPACVDRWW